MKKIAVVAVLTLAVATLVGCGIQNANQQSTTKTEPIKIGAILPLTGSSAIWGESIKQGMDLAQEESSQNGVNIQIFYEDSQAKSDQGITAYNKLNDIDKVNVFVSAFTNVSMPLIPLVNKDQKPLIMTTVATKNAAQGSGYAYRFFADDKSQALTHFKHGLNAPNYKSLGLLYVNSEYGQSVAQLIRDKAKEIGIKITADESFMPNSADLRSQLTKIAAGKPEAVMIVVASPGEIINSIKQAREMNLKSDIFEASTLLSMESARMQLGELANGVYTLAFPFTLGKTGSDFSREFMKKYNKAAIFPAAFGYDIVKIIAEAAGSSTDGNIAKALQSISSYNSANGAVKIDANHDIIPDVFSVRIVNGQLVPVE